MFGNAGPSHVELLGDFTGCPWTAEEQNCTLGGRCGWRDRATYRRGVGHGLDESLVLWRKRQLAISIHARQAFGLSAGLEDQLGHIPWKDDRAGIGAEPFLRHRTQFVPYAFD